MFILFVPVSLGMSLSVYICVPIWTPIFVAITVGTLRTYMHFYDFVMSACGLVSLQQCP